MGGQRWSPPLPLPTTRSDTPLRELSCTVCSSYHRLQLLNSYCLQGCLSQWCETRTIVTGDAKLTAGIYSPHQHSHDVHQCELFVCSLSLSPHTHTHTHTRWICFGRSASSGHSGTGALTPLALHSQIVLKLLRTESGLHRVALWLERNVPVDVWIPLFWYETQLYKRLRTAEAMKIAALEVCAG